MSGCITITTPKTPFTPAAPGTHRGAYSDKSPMDVPATANQTIKPLPSIADVVALVKPSVVAINTKVVSYDLFNRPIHRRE